ncbi:MAG: hypothetical protein A2X40_04480 [Elusimicrobia bacterium GWC2_65_9]|nr:MAG: hypothetical protein A2X40_04480 [Elusimicrobia bacterium GWC2_65_9]
MNIKTTHQFIAALLSSLLAAPAMAEALLPVQLQRIRPVSERSSPASKIKYKTEYGPAAQEPASPPNLTDEQFQKLADFLIPDPQNPADGLTPGIIDRLMKVLGELDMYYKRPIPQSEWDRLIKEMQDDFIKKNGQPGALTTLSTNQWDQSINEMLRGVVAKLGDPHTTFMDPKQAAAFNGSMTGKDFGGIGASLKKVPDGAELIIVFPDSPAKKADLRPGDVVTAIDGVPTKDQDLDLVVTRMRGEAGTPVNIRIKRLDEPVEVTRAAIPPREIFAKMAAPKVGYVYFSQFSEEIDEKVFRQIDRLVRDGATKLILDVRGNPGGLLSMADSIASEFLADEDIIETTKRQERVQKRTHTDGRGRDYGMPLAIIVNGYSASASEVIAAALQQHKKATVIGSQSYGKGSFQQVHPTVLPLYSYTGDVISYYQDGTLIKITEGGWYPPNDRSIEGKHDPATGMNIPESGGIVPDEIAKLSHDDEMKVMAGILAQLYQQVAPAVADPQLDKAIEVLDRR